MNTKDLSRMVGSDSAPRVPGEFVRYDENGTVPGSLPEVSLTDNGKHLVVVNGTWSAAENTQVGYVITATTRATIDGIRFPTLSATDIANITNAIKEGKSVSIYDASAGVYFVPMMATRSSETESSFIIFIVNQSAIINYHVNGDMVSVAVRKLNGLTT